MVSTSATAPPTVGRRWYALCVITLVYSCHFLDRSVVAIVAEPLREEFQLSDGQLGMLTGLAFGLLFAAAGIPMGVLVDRLNRRNLLAGVVFCWSGATALCGVAQSYAGLLAARMLVGAAESGGAPASMSLISDLFPPKQRTTAVGFYYLGNAVGGAMCVIVGAYVAAHYGWRAAFLVAGVPGMLLALIVLTTMREPLRGGADRALPAAAPKPSFGQGLRSIAANPAVLWLFSAAAMTSAALSVFGAWLPPFLMRSHAFALGGASLVLAIGGGVFGAFGAFAGGALADRLAGDRPGRRLLFAAILLCVTVPAALIALLIHVKAVAVAAVFGCFLLAFAAIPVAFASVLSLASPASRGITLAAMQVVTNLVGYGLGPFAVGLLSDALGGADSLRHAMAIVVVSCSLAAALSFYCANRSGPATSREN